MLSALRRLFARPSAARPTPPPGRFAPQVTALEDRTVPSGVPFKESLTLIGASEAGVLSYVGHATHFGKLTATLDTNTNVFTKVAADGSTASGLVTHTSATTGSIAITGGTGRFTGVTADSTYVLSVDAGGTTTVAVTGTLEKPSLGSQGGATVTVPFALTGGGPATGLPLVPGLSGPHSSTGTASLLGKHTGSGMFTLGSLNIDPMTGAVSGTFSGTYTFVAANGDELVMTYGAGNTGTFTAQMSADGTAVENVVFDAMFAADPDASTGRFAGATGEFRMIAKAASVSLVPNSAYTAPFEYTWVGDGELTLKKGKK